jgi:hypothetical protein
MDRGPSADQFARLRENRDHWAKRYVQTLRERDRAREQAARYMQIIERLQDGAHTLDKTP